MGVVYLAEDETLGREVALKILDRSIVTDPDFGARFRQEAKTIARLQHPNIVPIHALENIDGDLAIDMAYIDGGPLINSSASIEQALRWTVDVLSGLERCHDAEIVHRDVKPSNILLSTDGRALLSDFGLAKLLAVHQSTSLRSTSSSCMFVGTPMYAPPEAWEGLEPTPAWDVYSVGMVLYEKLAGKLPYDAETPLALLKQMLAKPIPPLSELVSNVSPELSNAVDAMLIHDLNARTPDASAALDRLQKSPEFERASRLSGATLVPRMAKPKSLMRQRATRFLRRAWMPAVLTIVLGWAIWAINTYSRDAGPEALDLTKPTVFDTLDPAGPSVWSAHCLIEPSGAPGTWRVLATGDTHLWMMRATRRDDGHIDLDGRWAEYSDPTARLFQYGECSGVGRFDKAHSEFGVTLTFRDVLDGEKWTRALFMRPSKGVGGSQAFLDRLKQADYISALLYNELQPRNADWLDEFENTWLSRTTRIVKVPFVDETRTPVVVDGVLDEPMWESPLTGDTLDAGRLDSEGAKGSMLELRYSVKALYVGIRGEAIPSATFAEIGLLRLFDVRTADSPRWMARIQGQQVVNTLNLVRQQQVPWQCDWQGCIVQDGNRWSAEICVPFEGMAPAQIPVDEQRWRMTCSLRRAGEEINSTPVAYWGSPTLLDVERGIVLRFESRELSR
ncbi:MAG: serine/threonine protein kinase [Candidatus Hydrogenedentes bacterium]|nr:serine/threonine protein kinase [Candidatus Hydrogenedentota bacterium]